MTDNLVIQEQQLDLRDLLSVNVKCIEFFGYLCPASCKRTYQKILYWIYAICFVGSCYVASVVSEFAAMVAVFGDIEKMTTASFLLLTHFVQTFKLYAVYRYAHRVRALIDSLSQKEFQAKNREQREILQHDIKMSKIITKTFLWMCVITCSLWGIFPLLEKGDDGTRLPLSGWYPFSTNSSPVFEVVYAYQTITAMINGLGNISLDTFMSGTIMIIAGQFAILNNSFGNMKLDNRLLAANILVENIEHHRKIIDFASETTFLFTTCIMGQFVVSVIIICITMFQMSLVPVLSLQFLSMVMYQACMLLEIFLLCYYGNEVILKSSKLTSSAYVCEWVDCPMEFQQHLLFFMTCSQKPLRLYAGGYFTLSLETFMAIIKSAWSYFAVLNRVHSADGGIR